MFTDKHILVVFQIHSIRKNKIGCEQFHNLYHKLMHLVGFQIIDQNIIKHKNAILKNKFIIGFAGIWFYEEFSEIVSIGVLKSHRRLGVAYLLISKLINYSHSKKMKIINLEVGKKNIEAQNLYRQFGFKINGYRKKYYLHNGDDAILMSLKI